MSYANIDQHTHDIVYKHLEHNKNFEAIIIHDEESDLAKALTESYKKCLPKVQLFNFETCNHDELLDAINTLQSERLVILVQTASFRMSKFRWRLELFHRNLRVIEHARLGHNTKDEEQTYIDSLTCDIEENSKFAEQLIAMFAKTKQLKFTCKDGSVFTIDGPFEEAKPNLGTYAPEQHKGGGFPVGEVFSEPINLDAFNGTLSIKAFPSMDHKTVISEPFTVTFKDGVLTEIGETAPQEFHELMKLPASENENGEIRLREVGLGLNKHISFDKPLSEVTAFERQRGLHFSVGMKHNIYRKKVPKDVVQKYHIDIFADIQEMSADGNIFFQDGEYVF